MALTGLANLSNILAEKRRNIQRLLQNARKRREALDKNINVNLPGGGTQQDVRIPTQDGTGSRLVSPDSAANQQGFAANDSRTGGQGQSPQPAVSNTGSAGGGAPAVAPPSKISPLELSADNFLNMGDTSELDDNQKKQIIQNMTVIRDGLLRSQQG